MVEGSPSGHRACCPSPCGQRRSPPWGPVGPTLPSLHAGLGGSRTGHPLTVGVVGLPCSWGVGARPRPPPRDDSAPRRNLQQGGLYLHMGLGLHILDPYWARILGPYFRIYLCPVNIGPCRSHRAGGLVCLGRTPLVGLACLYHTPQEGPVCLGRTYQVEVLFCPGRMVLREGALPPARTYLVGGL